MNLNVQNMLIFYYNKYLDTNYKVSLISTVGLAAM